MITIGVDYSISGPAVCVHEGDEWSIDNCTIHFMTTVKKNTGEYFDGAIVGTHLDAKAEKGMYPQERYLIRARWVEEIFRYAVDPSRDNYFAIESYSLNSKGKIDAIIENASAMKTLLFLERGVEFTAYPPTTLKKFATGSGKADKEKMILQFTKDTGWDIHEALTPDIKFGSGPAADAVDAYYTCKKKFEEAANV